MQTQRNDSESNISALPRYANLTFKAAFTGRPFEGFRFERVKAGSVISVQMKGRRYCLSERITCCQERQNLVISVCLCSVVYSTQHRSVWKYRRRRRPAGLPVPDPGSLFSRQHLLAPGTAIHNDCKEPFEHLQILWHRRWLDPIWYNLSGKQRGILNQHYLRWDGNLVCLSSCKYVRFEGFCLVSLLFCCVIWFPTL